MSSRGGSRNRSGPAPDPNSARSERRGLSFQALPNEGHRGGAPEFPLAPRSVYRWEYEDKRRYQVLDEDETEAAAERESVMWEWAWSTPQAAAWAVEPWRVPIVAMWVRTFVICESAEATAADKNSLHRFADQIGLSPAGMRENGWAIAQPDIATTVSGEAPRPASSRDRMKAKVSGG